MSSDCDSVIARYLQGDQDAFRTLLELQTPALVARIGRGMAPLLRRRVSVQDVLQEVSLVAFERRNSFGGRTREDFGRWIREIADRATLAQVNWHAGTSKRSVRHEVSQPSWANAEAISATPSPSQQAIGTEAEALAARALAQLPPDYREVLRLCREGRTSLREVGERMGRSHEAAKKLHGRAMMQFLNNFERLRGDRHE